MINGHGFIYIIIAQVLFFIITIILILLLIKYSNQNKISAKSILDKRLAQGKINLEDYNLCLKKINRNIKNL